MMNRGHYEYLDDVATADVAFRATGATLEDVFVACADATLEVMLPDPDTLENRVKRRITISAENEEMLLFNFLGEIIFLKDAEQLLLRVQSMEVSGGRIQAECAGDKIDAEKYVLGVDVKAVTMYKYHVRRTPAGWQAQVVLDI